MAELIVLVVVGTSIWVFFDAPAQGLSRTWALGCLALWIVAFPWYLSERGKTQLATRGLPERPTPASAPSATTGWFTDPRDPTRERWREGGVWTRDIRDKAPAPGGSSR